MEETNSLIEQRKAKLEALRARSIDPFQNKFTPTIGCGQARAKYVAGELKEGGHVEIAGRITAHRDMGKSMFMDLKDTSGRMQVYAQKQTLDSNAPDSFEVFKHLDLGDFIGVKGELFTTKAGEPSVKITSFVILAKTLRPPPAKWHGLEDTEIRYRQRYLDLMANDEVKDVFLKRAAIVHEMRNFMHSRGYVEVETPMMQSIPGGAAAQPFVTHHNALGCNFYLRIALELYHKRLLVGGIDRVFEIGRIFRNEGLSRRHNPEFTMMEAYQAYGDYETMMELVESMIKHLAQRVLGTLKVPRRQSAAISLALENALIALDEFLATDSSANAVQAIQQSRAQILELRNALGAKPEKDVASEAAKALVQCIAQNMDPDVLGESADETLKRFNERAEPWVKEFIHRIRYPWVDLMRAAKNSEIDLSKWKRARYKDLVRKMVSGKSNGKVADWFALSAEERRRVAIEELKMEGDIAAGYEDFEVTGAVFEKLIEPTLIQPTFVTHLPKELVPLAKLSPDDSATVEVFELCINGQEIAPGYTEQNNPIEQRERLEHQAGGEQQKLDEDFLIALEHGMPPAGGIGIGIDRLCMMLLGQESIRDVILFPQLKPK